MKARKVKIVLLIVACFMVTFPLLTTFTKLNKNIPLKGDVRLTKRPEFTLKGWLDGSFQELFEKYINDNIGFRPWFVRVRNQITYSLYGKLNAAYVIRGKENYFYEINYIKAYNGTDFIGKEAILDKAEKIKTLQDSLQKMDKTLIICIAPGKGSYYPEFIPDSYLMQKSDSTNYKIYKSVFDSLGVNCIDYNGWFMKMKEKSEYILYPRYGIHWSHYGMLLATDSLISYIENIRNIEMPHLRLTNFKVSKKLNDSDYDLAGGLNIIFKLPVDALCYPETTWEDKTGKEKPKVIVIADSFYWSMFGTEVWKKSFNPGGFWYYNKQIYPESFKQELKVEDVNHWDAINDNDVFIIIANEANLPYFPWGSVENFLEAFNPDYNKSFSSKKGENDDLRDQIQKYISIMKADEKWMKDIRKKARGNGISVDSMLVLDAKWLIDNNKNQNN